MRQHNYTGSHWEASQRVNVLGGLSLIEILVVCVLLSVLLSVLAPSATVLWRRIQSFVVIHRLTTALSWGRGVARQNEVPVTFCGSRDGLHCDGQWDRYQIIKTSSGIVHRFSVLPHGWRLFWRGSFGERRSMGWLPSGFTQGEQGSFYLCAPISFVSTRADRGLSVLMTGRWRLLTDSALLDRVCRLST